MVLVGAVGAIAVGFQTWRLLGGPVNGKRLREMDLKQAPLGLRAASRVFGTLAAAGLVVLVVGLFR
jgi:hypothetical protein